MSTRILDWEFDQDITAWTSAIVRTGFGQNRFVDLVVSETEDGAAWEVLIDATGEWDRGTAETLSDGLRAAIEAGLTLLVHAVSSRAS
jgi:hypothetical protein